jgi:hypothetical protein
MPISTFPRHDNYEDEYLLKPAGLRDTQSEGKVNQTPNSGENAVIYNSLNPDACCNTHIRVVTRIVSQFQGCKPPGKGESK